MKKDHKIRKRLLALVLTLTLVVTYMPTALFVYAENDNTAVTQEQTEDGENKIEVAPGQESGGEIIDEDTSDDQSSGKEQPKEPEGGTDAGSDDTNNTGGLTDYAENEGVVAFDVQGEAAESESAAAGALEDENDLSAKDAKRLAKSLFTVGASPDDAENAKLDGSEIEWIKTKWVTKDSSNAPAGDTENNLYVRPDSDDDQSVILQISYSLAGEHDYPKDTVSITIPSHMFRDRDGNIIGDIILPYAKAPNTSRDFNWDSYGEDIVFTNTRTLDAATKGYIEVAFDGLTPHDLKDMGISDSFDAYIEVLTHRNNRIGLRSEELTAQFDTDVTVNDAKKKQAGSVQVVNAASVPANARMDEQFPDEKYYVVVWWSVWGETTSNTMYTLTRTDTMTDGYAGRVDGATSADGRTSATTSKQMYKDGETGYYYYATYYPMSQFKAEQNYVFKNRITFKATEVDDPSRTSQKSASAQVSWHYTDPKWEEPKGHYNVHKNGNDGASGGYIMRHTSKYPGQTFTDEHVNIRFSEPNGFYGIYPNGLNDIQKNGSTDITYTINTIGYIFPWTYKEVVPGTKDETTGEWIIPPARIQANYNNKSVTMTTVEEGVCLNRSSGGNATELTVGSDYEYASVEFVKGVKVYKAVPHNINPDGSWNAETWGDGTFLYSNESDHTKYPDIELQIKRNGSWENWATASWHTGDTKEFKITLHDGSTTTKTIVDLPEGTEGFRTVVTAGDKAKGADIAAISYDVRPVIKLKNSAKMLGFIREGFAGSETPELFFYNNVDQIVTGEDDDGRDKTILAHNRKDGYDSVRGYTTDTKIYPTKEGVQELKDIDPEKQVYNIHYTVKIEEQSFISDKRTYEEAVASGDLPTETSGVWYDLLPEGVSYKEGSAKLRDPIEGQEYADSILSIRQYPKYKGTNRTLLVIRADRLVPQTVKQEVEGNQTAYYEDIPVLTFDAEYPFEAVSEDGDVLHNVVAFESGNESVGTIKDYSGEPDDPTAGKNVASMKAFSEDPDEKAAEINAMTDLDPNSDGERFVYAGKTINLKKVSAATTGLSKQVMVNNDGWWSSGVYETEAEAPANERIVYEGGTYSYKLRMESSIGTETKDIKLYDSLENFYAADGNSPLDINAPRWQGEFVGVDTAKLVAKGCKPVVYYSTIEGLRLEDEIEPGQGHPVNMDLSNSSIWTKASDYKGDLSAVKAVAIDASKKTDGSDFILDEKEVAVVEIMMHAPSGDAAREYIAQKAHAYNNIHMLATTVDKNTGVKNSDSYVRKDYTKVGIEEFKLVVTKDWDDDNNRDGIRPNSIVFHLLAKDNDTGEDVDTGKTVSLPQTDPESGEAVWTGEFNNIPYTDEHGRMIEYTIEEDPLDGYTTSRSFNKNETHFTNRHIPAKTRVEGEKTWENETDESTRPVRIRVDLYANGEQVATQVVEAKGDIGNTWAYSFEDLYKNENGKEIVYTVKETVIDTAGKSYSSEVDGLNIINTYHPYGDLTVEKVLEGATDKAAETEFNFTFTFIKETKGEDGSVSRDPVVTPYSYDVLDENGNVIEGLSGEVKSGDSIKIIGGQKIHVKDIDEYVNYTVEEERNRVFKLVSSSNRDGEIIPNQTAEASFTNRYTAEGSTQFEAFKVLENKTLTRNMFRYEVRQLNEDGSAVVVARGSNGNATNVDYTDEEETTVASSTSRVDLGAIEYDANDDGRTYTYEIVEVNTGKPGFTYDKTVYYATVKIEDLNGDGHLTCTTTYYDRDPSDPEAVVLDSPEQLLFKNKYNAEGDVVLQAWKILQGRELDPEQFTFELRDEKGNLIDTAKNGNAGSDKKLVTFKTLHFTEKDAGKTYHYKATEVVPAEGDPEFDPDIVYDQSVFDYYITIKDDGKGSLEFDVEYKKDGQDADPEFVNRLQDGGLIISKLISADSEDYDPDHEFRFRIEFDGEDVPVPTEINPVITHIDDPSSIPGYTAPAEQGASSGDSAVATEQEEDNSTGAAEVENDADENQSKSDDKFSLNSIINAVRPLEAHAEPASEPFHATEEQLEGKYAYAILTDGSLEGNNAGELVFFRSNEALQDKNRTEVDVEDIKGNKYHGILFSKYSGGYDLNLGLEHRKPKTGTTNGVPWYGTPYDDEIKTVRIAEGQAVRPENTTYWFYYKPALATVSLDRLDTSIDTDMTNMFCQTSKIKNLDLSGFDGSAVKTVAHMFESNSALESVDLRNFNTPMLEDAQGMFKNCTKVKTVNIAQLEIANTKNLSSMFYNCKALTTIEQNFGYTIASNADMMFMQCDNLGPVLDLSNFETPNLQSAAGMFRYDTSLVELHLDKFDISNLETLSGFFSWLTKLETITNSFGETKASDLSSMFEMCNKLKNVDLSGLKAPYATNMSKMFKSCYHLEEINLQNINTTSALNDVSEMFYDAQGTRKINIETLNTTGATNMKDMFGRYRSNSDREYENGAAGLLIIESITIGPDFSFKGDNIADTEKQAFFPVTNHKDSQGFKWIRDDRRYGPYYSPTLNDEYTSNMSGTWVWDKQMVINFYPEDEDTFGYMSPITVDDFKPYRYIDLPKNKFVKPGYRFKHWDDHKTGNPIGGNPSTRIYQDEGRLWTSYYVPSGVAELYAVFEKINNTTTSDDGTFYITLHGFEQALLEDLPAGLNYRVYEENPGGGWSLVGSGNTSGVIEPNAYPNAWFENEYNPGRTSVTLEGVKLLDEQAAPADSYSFVLKEGDETIETVSVSAGGAIKFSTIDYTADDIGPHTYTINELVPDNADPAIEYDEHTETVTVTVEEKDGKLQATVVYDSDKIVFKNTTKPGNLKLEKKTSVSGSDEWFSFRVRFVDKNGAAYTKEMGMSDSSARPDSSKPDAEGYITGKIKENGYIEFKDIPAGIRYVIEETDLPAGWTLTSAVGVTGTIAAGETQSAVLTNTYNASGNAEIIVHKELVGGDLKAGQFTFELLDDEMNVLQTQPNTAIDSNDKAPKLDEYGEPVLDEDGNAVYEDNPWKGTAAAIFDPINYIGADAGDHTYYIREVVPEDAVNADGVTYAAATDEQKQAGGFFKDGITYDSRLLTVVVTVTDNGNGTLKTKVVYKEGNKTVDELFSNKMTGSLSLSKIVQTGSPAKSDQEFEFHVTVKDEKGEPLTGSYEMIKADGSKGTVRFSSSGEASVKLKDGDTVTITGLPIGAAYKVDETPGDGWTVVTREGNEGTITTEPSAAAITNTYDAIGSAELEMHKELKNKTLEEGAFTFGLYDDKGNLISSVSNDADGVIKFPAMDYTLEDLGGAASKTFKYRISEMAGDMAGVVYDTNTYDVEVVVTDNGYGTLDAVPSQSSIEIKFVNTYGARGNTVIEGTKTIVNREFKEDDVWTFKLEPTGGTKSGKRIPASEVPMPLDDHGNRKSVDEYILNKDSGMTAGETSASFAFGRIYYTLADVGTYTYKVTETAGDINGITYDTKIYNVTVTVTDKGDGTLSITKRYQVLPRRVNSSKTGIAGLIEDISDFISDRIPGGTVRPGDGDLKPFDPIDPGHGGFDPEILTTPSADFSNIYSASGTATVGARKEMANNYWGALTAFDVRIKPVSAKDSKGRDIDANAMPMPADPTLTLTQAEPEKFFGSMTFTMAGTYNYVLYEVIPEDAVNAEGVAYKDATDDQLEAGGFTKDGIVYDTTDHTVTIKMEDLDNTGSLTATEIKYDGRTRTSALIINAYTADGSTDIAVNKVLTGREFQRGDNWTFNVTGVLEGDDDGTANVPMPKDANGREVTSVTITPDKDDISSQSAAFGTISYTLADAGKTYVYTITESGNVAGVTNAEPKEIRVSITDNKYGTLTVTKDPESASYTFTNAYSASGTAQLKATKTMDNWPDGQTFAFRLTPVDGSPMPVDADGNMLTEVAKEVTKESPEALFGDITFTAAGSYTYEISEVIPGDAINAAGKKYSEATDEEKAAGGFRKNCIEYSNAVHTATVTASEKALPDGTLDTVVKYDVPAGAETGGEDQLIITNTYIPPQISLTKKLDGFVDGGTMSNVTLAFKVEGFRQGSTTPVYTNFVGMTFGANDVDANNNYTKVATLTDLPIVDSIKVTEVYTGNYETDPATAATVEAVYNEYTGIWTVTMKNKHKGYTPGSGVVNKYREGQDPVQEGLVGSGGDTTAGNEGN